MPRPSRTSIFVVAVLGAIVLVSIGVVVYMRPTPETNNPPALIYQPRKHIESSGYVAVFLSAETWGVDASFEEYAAKYERAIPRGIAYMDNNIKSGDLPLVNCMLQKASLLHAKGDPASAYQVLEDLESRIKGTDLEGEWAFTIIYYKGLTGLRIGENDNCVMCRDESSCIFPLAPGAVHQVDTGSRLAVKHFSAYLRQFPDDLEVKYLLNLAYMTLGEHPEKVEPRHLLRFEPFAKAEFDIGRFRDIGHLVGVKRLNQSGGAIMEDFDNDGLFDVVVTSWAPNEPMAFYRNKGDGTFQERTKEAGLDKQLGGLYCVQTDFNNDGNMDIFVPRGSWMPRDLTQRPSLLRNNGNGTFTDVTREAGFLTPTNSTSATWADFDNDGFLDVFMCCQRQPCLLYRNNRDGTFEEVSFRAGLVGLTNVLGAAWIDFDNDGYPDLFVNISTGTAGSAGTGMAKLFRNNRDGTFTDVTKEMGIDGPESGFSCWAFDFDNDGWLDIFATTTSHTLEEVVQGMIDLPCQQKSKAKLFRNLGGKGFKDVAPQMGLDKVYSPMGSNFGDIDNDGYLDFYLGTGDPQLSTLVPNRLFKNVAGKRFAEVTASSRTGHLQKGHGVAFGDWRRSGVQDLFIQLGGAVKGDSYHNVLFHNPGHGNNWLSIKLIGAQTKDGKEKKTNKAAIGARIKVVTAGKNPLTVHRHVSSGSSFGANPLEQHIGLGKADRVERVEIFWPTSGTTQVFNDIAVNQGLVITEFAKDFQTRKWTPIPSPK